MGNHDSYSDCSKCIEYPMRHKFSQSEKSGLLSMLGDSRTHIPPIANVTLTRSSAAALPYSCTDAGSKASRQQRLWLIVVTIPGGLTENVKMDCGAVAAFAVDPDSCSNKSRFRLMKDPRILDVDKVVQGSETVVSKPPACMRKLSVRIVSAAERARQLF
jgi:hypothetical protein